MAQRILTVLDGSPSDAIVRDNTLALAKAGSAEISVVGITDPSRAITREAVPLGAMAFKIAADKKQYAQRKETVAARAEDLVSACRSASADASIKILEGNPVRELAGLWHDRDLLIMGRERRGHGTHLLPSRKLIRFLHDCPRPVMISSPMQANNPETVAIAYDGSNTARLALENFLKLGLGPSLRLEIVSVSGQLPEAKALSETAADICRGFGVTCQTYAIGAERQPLSVLANRLLALRPGLMVAASEGLNTWRELLFGSLPARLLRGSGATLYLHR